MTESTREMSAGRPVALITGGARRIGRALCEAFHKDGFDLIIHCNRSTGEAEKLARVLNDQRETSAIVVAADLNNSTELQLLCEATGQFRGRLDVLINNASTFYPTPLGSITELNWLDLIGSNLKAPLFLAQTLAPLLQQHAGCILNISDIHAQRPIAGHTVYCIAKAGNEMLTKSLALELAPKVRVNGIAPGAILWPEEGGLVEQPNLARLNRIPLGTLGGVDAITRIALFIVRHGDYLTGEIIKVDGGASLT